MRHLGKTLSGSDIRYRLVAGGVYELPAGRNKALAIKSAVLNGIIEQTNRSNTSRHGPQPNILDSHVLSGGRSKTKRVAHWFDTSQLESPGVGVFGNSPPKLCWASGFAVVDISAQKRFRKTERTMLELSADFSNLPNHANFRIQEHGLANSGFGRIRDVIRTQRQTQLGLRLEFQRRYLGRRRFDDPTVGRLCGYALRSA